MPAALNTKVRCVKEAVENCKIISLRKDKEECPIHKDIRII